MAEEHIKGKSMAQRISDRLKPSNDMSHATTVVHKGTGPTRTITTVHSSGNQCGLANAKNGPSAGSYGRGEKYDQ
jgi:hypothetical protein